MQIEMMKRGLSFNVRRKRSEGVETTTCSASKEEEIECEMRPGGMLVQKRSENSEVVAVPNLRIRVTFGAVRYQISANSRSTFGELKKLLTVETGLQPNEQRLIFRGKERENGHYLDKSGVRDRSKVILIEDPESIGRKLIETRRIEKIQAANRLIEDVSMEVDKLAEQVHAIEKSIANGNKVAELQITTLIEMLMRQAVKLDCINIAEGDACAKKDSQSKKVQKCVETLDILKVRNANVKVATMAVTSSKWETFDSTLATMQWELFD